MFLSHLPGDENDRVADAVTFKGQANGETLGRHPDGADGWIRLSPTRNEANKTVPENLILREIMYHPADSEGYEYIVLHNPAKVNGELGLGFSWMEPHDDLLAGAPVPLPSGRNQYGLDLYWKILLTPNLWVTPGVQYVIDPTLNPFADDVTILGFKFRWFF